MNNLKLKGNRMKKRVMVALIAMLSLMLVGSAVAENPVQKGNLYMMGSWNANFTATSGDLYDGGEQSDVDAPTHFELDPEVGFFVTDGFAIGARLSFTSTSQGDAKSTSYSAGPAVSYYFFKDEEAKGRIIPFVRASFEYGKIKQEDGGVGIPITPDFPGTFKSTAFGKSAGALETTSELTVYRLDVSGGGVWMLSNTFGVFGEAFFNLDNAKQDVPEVPEGIDDSQSGNRFGVNIGVKGFFNFGN